MPQPLIRNGFSPSPDAAELEADMQADKLSQAAKQFFISISCGERFRDNGNMFFILFEPHRREAEY
jgi:hypothetical protein